MSVATIEFNSRTPRAFWMKFAGRAHDIKRDLHTKYEDNHVKRLVVIGMRHVDSKSALVEGATHGFNWGTCLKPIS